MFEILGVEGDKEKPSVLQIMVPAELAEREVAKLRDVAIFLTEELGASHALAGYALATSPYEEETSQTFAYARSMRHRGIDIPLTLSDRWTVRRDGIKGVNWLTFLDQMRVDRLGGAAALRKTLHPAVEVMTIGGCILMQAGEKPAIRDENRRDRLPLYRSVFHAIEPLTVEAFRRAGSLKLENDGERDEMSMRWRRRLGNG